MSDQLQAGGLAGRGWLTAYAAAFGIGLILMLAMLMVSIGQSADGVRVSSLDMLRYSGVRAALYIPVMTVLPGAVWLCYEAAGGLAAYFLAGAQAEATTMLDKLAEGFGPALTVGGVGAVVAGQGGPAAVLLLILALVALVAVVALFVEVTAAAMGLFVLTATMPLAFAMAVHPKFRSASTKIISAAVGLLLVKPVVWFALWTLANLVNFTEGDNPLTTVVVLVGALLLAASAPVLISSILPRILEGINERHEFQRAGDRVTQAVQGQAQRAGQAAWRASTNSGGSGGGSGKYSSAPSSSSEVTSETSADTGMETAPTADGTSPVVQADPATTGSATSATASATPLAESTAAAGASGSAEVTTAAAGGAATGGATLVAGAAAAGLEAAANGMDTIAQQTLVGDPGTSGPSGSVSGGNDQIGAAPEAPTGAPMVPPSSPDAPPSAQGGPSGPSAPLMEGPTSGAQPAAPTGGE